MRILMAEYVESFLFLKSFYHSYTNTILGERLLRPIIHFFKIFLTQADTANCHRHYNCIFLIALL